MLPWVHLQINQSGNVHPCCRMDESLSYGSLEESTLDQIWNDEPIKDLRRRMLNGESSSACSDCYRVEAGGGASLRQFANRTFEASSVRLQATADDGTLLAGNVLSLDLRFSNLCNFSCRTCSPENSTAWYPNANVLQNRPMPEGPIQPFGVKHGLRPLLLKLLPKLQYIYFAGGEPLLQEDHYWLLGELIALGKTDVILEYNSNFSLLTYRHWDAPSLWNQFERVIVGASLDGAGAQGELLRKGMRWNSTVQNFRRLRAQSPHVRIFVHSTISAMNAFHITGAIDQWINEGVLDESTVVSFNILNTPTHMSVSILNARERERLRECYENYLNKIRPKVASVLFESVENGIKTVLAALSNVPDPVERARFKESILALDLIRNENFPRLFPEWEGLFQESNRGN